jgi:hypothetical protein
MIIVTNLTNLNDLFKTMVEDKVVFKETKLLQVLRELMDGINKLRARQQIQLAKF